MEKLGCSDPAHPSAGAAGSVAGETVTKKVPRRIEGDEARAVASYKLFHCACFGRWLPQAYREELYHVLHLTGPLVSRGKLKYWWGRGLGCYPLVTVFLLYYTAQPVH